MNINKAFIAFLLFLIFFQSFSFAQKIECDHIYWVNNSEIFEYDPLMEISKYTGFNSPPGASGIAIAPNINGGGKELTFYCVVNERINYYDGKTWINTGHLSGSVNLAGGGNYIYILDGINSKLFRYDGKENAKELLKFNSFAGPFDLVADSKGNFYLIFTKMNKMVQYDPEGKVLKQYRLEGLSGQTSGGGFAYRDNVIYGNFTSGSMIGVFKGGVIRFTPTGLIPNSVDDFASCPLEMYEPEKKPDTVKIDTAEVIKDVVFTDGNIPLSIKDREVKLQSSITVHEPEFEIEIWDISMPDGDSISLNLNGKWILENYEVVKAKLKMKVSIHADSPNNYLILFAHNLGKISPNTAAVSVLINGQQHKLSLTSDLKSSGALNFIYEPE